MTKQLNIIFEKFISKEALSGALLFGAAVIAVIFANSSLSEWYYELWKQPFGVVLEGKDFSMSLHMWINDGLMALFFLMVGLEIKRELLIGELSSLQKASFPVIAAVGGMLIPAFIYIALNPDNYMGFGIPMATDIAFALGILLLLGNKVSPMLKLFLVALAVVDDLGAVMVVAIVYTSEIHFEYFVHFALIYGLIWFLNYKGVKALTPYLILGAFLWFYIHAIGVHATVAGVLLALAIPISSKIDEDCFICDARLAIDDFEKKMDDSPVLNHHQIESLESISCSYDKVQNPLVKLEHKLHGFSAFFIMPIFAFANAGVVIDFGGVNEHLMVVLGIVFGLVIGKPIGIVMFTYLLSKLGITKKPDELSWSEIIAAGFLAGIGFTMSIFITNLAFLDENIISAAKLGIFLASFIAAVIGVVMINIAHAKKNKAKN